MSTTTTPPPPAVWDDALRLSDPALYDTVSPEQRQSALEKALSLPRSDDSTTDPFSSCGHASFLTTQQQQQQQPVLLTTDTTREVVLRAVCDPWSTIRKAMVRIVVPQLVALSSSSSGSSNGDDDSSSALVESFMIASAGKVLGGNNRTLSPASSTGFAAPWYAIDGFLGLLKAVLTSTSTSTSTSTAAAVEVEVEEEEEHAIISFTGCQTLLRLTLPFVAHAQEVVREAAVDCSVTLLSKKKRKEQSEGDNNVISVQEVEDVVVAGAGGASGGGEIPAWWAAAIASVGGVANHHLLEQGRIALAFRGIGINKLFAMQPASSPSSSSSSTLLGLSPTLLRWAKSPLASVRFGCGSLFPRSDFSASGSAASAWLPPSEVDRRLKLAVDATFLMTPGDWTVQETAGVAAGDLLRVYLPRRYHFAPASFQSPSASEHPSPERTFSLQETATMLCSVHRVAAESKQFDVRRACAQLLPLLAAFFVASWKRPSAAAAAAAVEDDDDESDINSFALNLLSLLVVSPTAEEEKENGGVSMSSSSSSSSSSCCDGVPQLTGTCSCCPAQNIVWFWIIRSAFESRTKSTDVNQQQQQQQSSLLLEKLKKQCPRVALLLAVYRRGLFQEEQKPDDVDSSAATAKGENNSSHISEQPLTFFKILPCDVRWLADWLRLAPEEVIQSSSATQMLSYTIEHLHAEPHVQELIFTALHDAAHVLHQRVWNDPKTQLLLLLLRQQHQHHHHHQYSHASAPASDMATPSCATFPSADSSPAARGYPFRENFSISRSVVAAVQRVESVSVVGADDNESSTFEPQQADDGQASGSAAVATASAEPTALHLPPFLFAMDSRFAPATLRQDGSDQLEDGTSWVQALIRRGAAAPSAASAATSGGAPSVSSGGDPLGNMMRRRGSLLVARHGLEHFSSIQRWSSSASTQCIARNVSELVIVAADLVHLLLNTCVKTASNLEHAALLRAADATRACIRTFGSFVVNQQQQQQQPLSLGDSPTRVNKSDSDTLTRLIEPWLVRLDMRRAAFAKAASEQQLHEGKEQKRKEKKKEKASESNWDDDSDDGDSADTYSSSSDDDDVKGANKNSIKNSKENNNVGTSVTWEQEVEAAKAALRHVIHVVHDDDNYYNNNNNNGNGNSGISPHRHHHYEPERVSFVRESLAALKEQHAESCRLLDV